jgi:hypothetical protein
MHRGGRSFYFALSTISGRGESRALCVDTFAWHALYEVVCLSRRGADTIPTQKFALLTFSYWLPRKRPAPPSLSAAAILLPSVLPALSKTIYIIIVTSMPHVSLV